jgi:two-component system chemotaxis response regulator CheB
LKHLEPSKIVLIGASTGGPGQIHKIIKALPLLKNTSVIIAQHMSTGFLESFTQRLQQLTLNQVVLTENSLDLQPATLYVCGENVVLEKKEKHMMFTQKQRTKEGFNPDINLIFNSLIPVCNTIEILNVILTGIGEDGIEASLKLSQKGVRCLTETSSSAIIDGMPARAREKVANIEAYDIEEIIHQIKEFCN